jgi:hypothetical protein
VKPIALPEPVLPGFTSPQEISFVPEEPAPAPVATQEPSPEAPLQPQEQDIEPVDETWATLMAEIRGR